MALEIERLGEVTCDLGENPLWDPVDGVLYWVDSRAPAIFRLDPASGAMRQWTLAAKTIGSMALRAGGGAVVALDSGFHLFDFATGALERVADPEAGLARTRFNDGKVDRRGRFISGTIDDAEDKAPVCGLYRLDPDLTVSKLDDGIITTNGPCWSPDSRTLYLADSQILTIFAYDYDLETGTVANKRPFVVTREFRAAPDGATVDAEGFLWTALVIGGKLGRFAPDGRLDRLVEMPVRYVTSVMFGGPDLETLYVTSIGGELNGRMAKEPEAGGLFAVRGLGVRGLPETRFAG